MNLLDNLYNLLESNIISSPCSGALDIIVIKQKEGSLKSTAFHVRFSCIHSLNSNS